MTITGNSLHYYVRPDFWFKATVKLTAGTDPQQFRATIKDCAQGKKDSTIGKVVAALFKIKDGTLTLATIQDSDAEHAAVPPKNLEEKGTLIVLRKVQPPKRKPNH